MRHLILPALAAGVILSAGAAQAADTMRCSHQLPPKHHIAKVIDQWAAEVNKLAGDDLKVEVHGANSLRDAKQNIAAVAKGHIECAFSVNFQWGKTVPEMNVTLKPYSVTDLKVLRKWPGSPAAQFLEDKIMAKGVKNVVWLFTTNMSAYTSKGIALIAPDDFKGVKIRGLNKLVDSGLIALGAAPSAMSGSKVYQALSTGVIDAGLSRHCSHSDLAVDSGLAATVPWSGLFGNEHRRHMRDLGGENQFSHFSLPVGPGPKAFKKLLRGLF